MPPDASPPLTLESSLPALGRPYRRGLAAVAVLMAAAGGLLYLENGALASLVVAVTGEGAPGLLGARSAALLAVAYVAIRLLHLLAWHWETMVAARVDDRGRRDLEREVMERAIRNGEAVAQRRVGELVPELGFHVGRVLERRHALRVLVESAPIVASELAFLAVADWRVGALGAVVAVVSVGWSLAGQRELMRREERAGIAEGAVRNRTLEVFRVAAELEVHDGAAAASRDVGVRQRVRADAKLGVARLGSAIYVATELTHGTALAALVVLAARLADAGLAVRAAALVPVLVRALPSLFQNVGDVVHALSAFRRGGLSAARLTALLPPPEAAGAPVTPAGPLAVEVEGATFRHGGAGGIVDVDVRAAPGAWIALVGGSGAGKSTFLDLLLGRRRPQAGSIRAGGREVSALSRPERAAVFTFMPQELGLLEGSIAENLHVGAEAAGLGAPDLAVVESIGLGEHCRRRALAVPPEGADEGADAIAAGLPELRRRLRERVAAAGISLRPLGPAAPRAEPWVAEVLCGAPLDRDAALAALLARPARRALARLAEAPDGAALVAAGARVVAESRALLSIAEYARFASLSPRRLPEPLWELRREVLRGGTPEAAILVALLADTEEAGFSAGAELGGAASAVRAILGGAVIPLDPAALHPVLPWRENLLLAAVVATSRRAEAEADRVLLAAVDEEGLSPVLLRAGLRAPVGRGGALLSGGQRQLVALCRALLRRTPVLILDEPTSALDPASRDRVIAFLRAWTPGRVVLTVTHDHALARAADEYVLLEAGRVAARGPGAAYAARGAAA